MLRKLKFLKTFVVR